MISNVPGPPFPLYYAGAKLCTRCPMGPVMEGAGLNITVLSYMDNVDIGFMACRELVPDVWTWPTTSRTMAELSPPWTPSPTPPSRPGGLDEPRCRPRPRQPRKAATRRRCEEGRAKRVAKKARPRAVDERTGDLPYLTTIRSA